MKPARALALLLAAGIGAVAGLLASRTVLPPAPGDTGGGPSEEAGVCPGGARPLYWKAPMDPTYIRDKPGKSPMGMDLVPVCPGAEGDSGPGVRIDPATLQNMGVRTAPVVRRDLSRRIRAVGRVTWDERLVAHVHTKIQGWVEKLYVDYEGQEVRRGQPMLEIYSPELVATQEELLRARRYRELTTRSGLADIQESGEALYRATLRRLKLWDIPQSEIDRLLETGEVRRTLTLLAPRSGIVVELTVREGMEIAPNENLFTIADLHRVWILADVYEYELPWVAVGQRATVELSYLPGRIFEGEVTYIYPYLDPKTRTARVRIELENPEEILKPDMFANVTLHADPRPGVLVVPDEAVIRSGRRNVVIVALGGGRFDPRTVQLGIESGDGSVEVIHGLREGEEVVVSGQFLIDSESRLKEAIQKMLSPDAEGGGAMDHSGHDMDGGAMDHSGHDMGGGAKDPSGHDMGTPGAAPRAPGE